MFVSVFTNTCLSIDVVHSVQVFCCDNILFLQVMYPGNVPQSSGPWDTSLGDLVLALPYIQQQCKEENTTLDERVPVRLTF